MDQDVPGSSLGRTVQIFVAAAMRPYVTITVATCRFFVRQRLVACRRQVLLTLADPDRIGNESVPIQLAQCWFSGLAISSAEI